MRFTPAACLVLCVSGALFTSGARAQVSVVDQNFANSDWTLIARPYGPNGGGGSGAQVLTGGTGPGAGSAARQITNQAGSGGSGSYNASIYTALVYDPAVSGPLTNLAISIDARYASGLSAIGGAVEQGGLVWFFDYQINTPGWQTFSFTSAVTGWYQINGGGTLLGAGPDFSAGGAPMRFGFFTANGSSSGGFGYANTGLYDNFALSFVPAPGAAAAMVGLGAITAMRRRRV
jgi:MYXO-CTERM domain-containing protein